MSSDLLEWFYLYRYRTRHIAEAVFINFMRFR
jgi:hypothetical protein